MPLQTTIFWEKSNFPLLLSESSLKEKRNGCNSKPRKDPLHGFPPEEKSKSLPNTSTMVNKPLPEVPQLLPLLPNTELLLLNTLLKVVLLLNMLPNTPLKELPNILLKEVPLNILPKVDNILLPVDSTLLPADNILLPTELLNTPLNPAMLLLPKDTLPNTPLKEVTHPKEDTPHKEVTLPKDTLLNTHLKEDTHPKEATPLKEVTLLLMAATVEWEEWEEWVEWAVMDNSHPLLTTSPFLDLMPLPI